MSIQWTIVDGGPVEVVVSGSPTVNEFKSYIADLTQAGFRGHAKLVDMRHAALDLRSADVRAIAAAVIAQANTPDATLGPVAIIVDADSSLEFCMLFDERTSAANRALAIFADRAMAQSWLQAAISTLSSSQRPLANR